MNPRPTGFSLIELLVVVSIIAVLAATLLPAVRLVRDAAQGARCQSNHRQITAAVLSYVDEHDGLLPYSHTWGETPNARWAYDDSLLGQYIADGRRVKVCPAETWPIIGDHYGLNTAFCPTSYETRFTALARIAGLADTPITCDTRDCRWGVGWDAGSFHGYGDLDAVPWSSGHSPCSWVGRHQGGVELGFLDGHVRASRDPGAEVQAGTLRPWGGNQR